MEEKGELFPAEALRVKSPERAHMLGPAFEAEISTPHGQGRINFLLTRQGLELGDEAMAKNPHGTPGDPETPLPTPGRYLN